MFLGVLDALLYHDYMFQRAPSAYLTDATILFFKMAIFRMKLFLSATNKKVFFSKILKHKVTWSRSSILVVAVVLDQRSFNFFLRKRSEGDISLTSFKKWQA